MGLQRRRRSAFCAQHPRAPGIRRNRAPPGGDPEAGGAPVRGPLTVNDTTAIVPRQFGDSNKANALPWAELFDAARSKPVFDTTLPPQATPLINHPATNSIGQPMTGLALS